MIGIRQRDLQLLDTGNGLKRGGFQGAHPSLLTYQKAVFGQHPIHMAEWFGICSSNKSRVFNS